jgi:ferritin-like metal-binding protein YciE
LAEIQDGEKQLTLALPLIRAAATSDDLKVLLELHLKETKGHVRTTTEVAESLGKELPHKSCLPMRELIKEGIKVIAKKLSSSDQDAALIAMGQKIEQYEIGIYTMLCSRAEEMGCIHEVALLTSTLNQEKMANELLAGLAQGKLSLQKLIEQTSLKKVGARTEDSA